MCFIEEQQIIERLPLEAFNDIQKNCPPTWLRNPKLSEKLEILLPWPYSACLPGVYRYMQCYSICSAQSENLHNLEIALRILGISRLRKCRNHLAVTREATKTSDFV